MSDETEAAARRYSHDMRQIREDRGVSIGDIHEETRIAQTLIESFEDGSLYDHPSFNRIYLRSFIRVYAEAIEISPEEALEALEAGLDGTYQGELADRYLRGKPRDTEDPADVSSSDSTSAPADEASVGDSSSDDKRGADETSEQTDPSETYPHSSPSGGGIGGREGIVGPVRAVGQSDADQSDEDSSDVEEADSGPAETGSFSSEEEEDDPTEEEPSPAGTSSESTPDDTEAFSFSGRDQQEDASSPQGEDEPDSFSSREQSSEEKTPGVTGEAGAEGATAESPRDEPRHDDSFSSSGSGTESDMDSQLEGGISGIVGGPKELGSSSEEPSTPTSSDPRPIESTRPPKPPSSSASKGRGERRRRILLSGLGILVLIGLLGGVTFFITTSESTSPEEDPLTAAEDTSQTVAVQDTAVATQDTVITTDPAEERPPASLTLGDTLAVTVFAESNLSEIRVQRDGDLRRPYWIEEGEAAVFPFTEQIIFQNDLDDARFFLEHYPYPSPERDELGRIVIDRSIAAAFADTLRGEPHSFAVTPDTIPIGNPIPESALD